jgi:tripartite-type tricarboxylate transporter receptor subunit TctC
VSKLNQEIGRILQMPEIHAKIEGMGASAYPQSAEAFNAMLKADLARYGVVMQKTKLSPVN